MMSLRIDDNNLLEKYKTICTKTEGFEIVESHAFPVYDDSSIKNKIRTNGDKVYTNFRGLNVPEDDVKCETLQPFLLILYLFMKTNITFKYI